MNKAEAKYEVIKPPVDLRNKVKKYTGRNAQFDPIANAERALHQLSSQFSTWLNDEIDSLVEAYHNAEEKEFNSEASDDFFRAAHNIKGQALTFGYPLIGEVAGNLCYLFEKVKLELIPRALLKKHVLAMQAMMKEDAKNIDNKTGKALLKTLQDVRDELLAKQKKLKEAKA